MDLTCGGLGQVDSDKIGSAWMHPIVGPAQETSPKISARTVAQIDGFWAFLFPWEISFK